MTFKYIFVFISALVAIAASSQYREMKNVYENRQELPCLAYGGICVRTSDCPADKRRPTKGLCPKNQEEGFQCCHSVGESETRCRAHGGECMPLRSRCPEHLTVSRATDCQAKEKCCVLVRR